MGTLHQILSEWSHKEDKMGEACSVHGRDANMHKNFVQKPEGKTQPSRK
jgi:hypothetical protein